MMTKFLLPVLFVFLMQPVFAAYYHTSPASADQAVEQSVNAFKQLSAREKKERINKVKKEIKKYRQNGYADERTLLYVILAILLPPLAVYLHQGEINSKFWISLLLSFLFWIPGVIYSLLVVLDKV